MPRDPQSPNEPLESVMSLRPIITLPDPVLRQTSDTVERFDEELKRLAADMLETMYHAPGVGLAAIQVAVPKRLIVLDVGPGDGDEDVDADDDPHAEGENAAEPAADAPKKPPVRNPIVMVNPRLLTLGSTMRLYEEGCLSLPDIHVEIERPATLKLAYQDLEGVPRELDAGGLLATAIQHEIDHLDGKLIIDFLSTLKRDMVIRRFKKQSRQT